MLPQLKVDAQVLAERLQWSSDQPHGTLAEIARKTKVSRSMVTQIIQGRNNTEDLRVERELHKRGCPGFEFVQQTAA